MLDRKAWELVERLVEAGARVELERRGEALLGTYYYDPRDGGAHVVTDISPGGHVFVNDRVGPPLDGAPNIYHIQLVGETPLYGASIHHQDDGHLAQHAVFGDWVSPGGNSIAGLRMFRGKTVFLLAGYFVGNKLTTRLYWQDAILRSFEGDIIGVGLGSNPIREHDGGLALFFQGEGALISRAELERAESGVTSGPYR